MNKIKYTCDTDSRDSLHVVERYMDRLSFITEREGNWTGSAWLSNEDTADLARRLAEHVGLTIEPEPFKRDAAFEDIREGDLVLVEWMLGDVTITRTGVAHSLLSSGWYTVKDEYLRGLNTIATITILSRPTPSLPTEPGAVILVDLPWGTVAATRTTSWLWRFYDLDGDYHTYDDETIGGYPWKQAKVVEA